MSSPSLNQLVKLRDYKNNVGPNLFEIIVSLYFKWPHRPLRSLTADLLVDPWHSSEAAAAGLQVPC